jgi:hypothetical protein
MQIFIHIDIHECIPLPLSSLRPPPILPLFLRTRTASYEIRNKRKSEINRGRITCIHIDI